MKTDRVILGAFALTLTSMFSCKKQDQPGTNLSYQIRTTNRASALALASTKGGMGTARGAGISGGSINWTTGYASVSEIEFVSQDAAGELDYHSEARHKIDLFAAVSDLGGVAVPQGNYNQAAIQIALQPAAPDAALYLLGSYNGTALIFQVDEELDIDANLARVTIAAGQSYNSLTALNLANLTQGIAASAMDSATKDAQGTIMISATSNTAIYNQMLANMKGIEEEEFY